MRWLVLIVVLFGACKAPTPSNAPSPTACVADTDCTIVTVGPDPADACCDIMMSAAPMSRAHLAFIANWRAHCDHPKCPKLALPAAPGLPCSEQPKCVAQKCTNACN